MNSTKRHPQVLTLEGMRKQAQEDAAALKRACGGQNKAAAKIGMSKGRFSFIVNGQWRQVAVNEIDLVMLATGRVILEKDLALTTELRQLAEQFQKQLADIHETAGKLIKGMKKL